MDYIEKYPIKNPLPCRTNFGEKTNGYLFSASYKLDDVLWSVTWWKRGSHIKGIGVLVGNFEKNP